MNMSAVKNPKLGDAVAIETQKEFIKQIFQMSCSLK